MIGKTISHYKILEKLGAGGMGVVYKAQDTKLDRFVALKFLPPHLSQAEEEKKRFIHEAKAASALDHPNICTIHEIDETEDGQMFIAMACYEGESLKDKIERGPMAIEEAIDIATQISRGLAKAHSKEIIHRDIKPANLLITEDDTVKIVDFGLAKLAGRTMLTKDGTTLGTALYMSPEQTQGASVDQRTDIWALAVVLYEMITGEQPFKGDYEQAVMYSIMNEDPEPPTALRTGVPMELERIVLKAMAKEPDERYQHVDDLLTDLQLLRKQVDVGTAAQRMPAKMGFSQRNRKWFVTIAAVLLLVSGVASYLFFRSLGSELDSNRIIVTLFENRTGDSSLDLIGNMATDRITHGLSLLEIAEVVPTSLVLQLSQTLGKDRRAFQNRNQLEALADEANANLVVSGAYYLIGDSLQFHAEITDLKRNELLYSFADMRGLRADPMNVIESLRSQITGALVVKLAPQGGSLSYPGSKPPSFEAYQQYMTGLEFFGTDYVRAIRHFFKAASLDSTFFSPLGYIAVAYFNQRNYTKADSLAQILNARRARLTPFDRHSLDFLTSLLRGNQQEALRHVHLATKLAPKHHGMNYVVGWLSIKVNRPHETVTAYSKFVPTKDYYESRTGWWRFMNLATAYHMLGNYQEQIEVARKLFTFYPAVLTLRVMEVGGLAALGRHEEIGQVINESLGTSSRSGSPGDVMSVAVMELRAHGYWEEARRIANRAVEWCEGHNTKASEQFRFALSLYLAERWQEAQSVLQELVAKDPENIGYLGVLGATAARMGEKEEALRVFAKLKNIDRRFLFGLNTYYRARIATLLDEHEEAVTLLRQAFSEGRSYGLYLHRETDFESLHDNAAFQELTRPKG